MEAVGGMLGAAAGATMGVIVGGPVLGWAGLLGGCGLGIKFGESNRGRALLQSCCSHDCGSSDGNNINVYGNNTEYSDTEKSHYPCHYSGGGEGGMGMCPMHGPYIHPPVGNPPSQEALQRHNSAVADHMAESKYQQYRYHTSLRTPTPQFGDADE